MCGPVILLTHITFIGTPFLAIITGPGNYDTFPDAVIAEYTYKGVEGRLDGNIFCVLFYIVIL